jgi:hypothetical protein
MRILPGFSVTQNKANFPLLGLDRAVETLTGRVDRRRLSTVSCLCEHEQASVNISGI